jgi:protein-S-isoprenylcysteine O-methyltransferase Ste14
MTGSAVLEILLTCVTTAALIRSAWLLVGLVRVVPVHRRARIRRWGLVEGLAFAELPVFLALTGLLVVRPPVVTAVGSLVLPAAALGALLALAGLGVSLWAIYTTVRRRVILDAGHFVKEVHALITTGAYGFVRNPMYLGIILLWLGIAVSFRSPLLLLVAAAYVVPVLWLYIRAEERMLASEFGAAFEAYCSSVGRLLPRLR